MLEWLKYTEYLVEWKLAGETEALGENLPHSATFATRNPLRHGLVSISARRYERSRNNRLSYDTALSLIWT
jgi:hypothetical protein